MATNILIVGGGLAGTIVANGLCRQLAVEMKSGQVGMKYGLLKIAPMVAKKAVTAATETTIIITLTIARQTPCKR